MKLYVLPGRKIPWVRGNNIYNWSVMSESNTYIIGLGNVRIAEYLTTRSHLTHPVFFHPNAFTNTLMQRLPGLKHLYIDIGHRSMPFLRRHHSQFRLVQE